MYRNLLTVALLFSISTALAQDYLSMQPLGRPMADRLVNSGTSPHEAGTIALPDSEVWPSANPPDANSSGANLSPAALPLGLPVQDNELNRNSMAISAGALPIQSDHPFPLVNQRLSESTWYSRIDYFHWNERIYNLDFVNEDGALITIGYVRRSGPERFRAELFGGQVHYSGLILYDDGSSELLSSHTNYLGLRGECDLLYEPDWLPAASLFLGIGTRFWFRDLPDDLTDSGTLIIGYQETWWTIYPYLGMEKRRVLRNDMEFYYAGRIGLTAITYEHATLNDTVLYPQPGIMGQLEGGLRARHVFISAFFEAITWAESAVVRDSLQPQSKMFTAGLRSGFCF